MNNTTRNTNYEEITTNFLRIQILMCTLGLLCNSITIKIFFRKSLRKYTFSFYCRILVFIDSLLLAHVLIHSVIIVSNAVQPKIGHVSCFLVLMFFCSIKDFLGLTLGTMSLLMLTLISFDRFITIVYPKQFLIFTQRWFQIILVLIVILYSFLANINVIVYFHYETVDLGNGIVKSVCYLPFDKQNIQSWILFAQFLLANLIVNNFFNIRIICRIVDSRRKTKKMRQIAQSSLKDRKFAISAIGLNITSFISRIPVAVGILLSNYLGLTPEQAQLVFTASVTIAILDHSFTLFINILLNSLFYKELLTIIGVKRKSYLDASDNF